jgi:hypothetical protein
MQVQFQKHYAIYNAGEIAGFEDAKANALISEGIAKPYPPVVVEEAPVEEAAEDKKSTKKR